MREYNGTEPDLIEEESRFHRSSLEGAKVRVMPEECQRRSDVVVQLSLTPSCDNGTCPHAAGVSRCAVSSLCPLVRGRGI